MPNNQIAPCQCESLEREANHPDSPIRFDPKLNEYHFIYRTSTGEEAKMMIYHCPFCGGRAPESRRDELFHRLTEAERHRLFNEITGANAGGPRQLANEFRHRLGVVA